VIHEQKTKCVKFNGIATNLSEDLVNRWVGLWRGSEF